MTAFLYTCVTLLVTISVILILLVLIQKGRGGGLASAFGGVGGHTAFGSKTGDVLTWATSVVFGIFLILSIVTGVVFDRVNSSRRTAGTPTVLPAGGGGGGGAAGGGGGGAPADAQGEAPAPAPEPATPTSR